MNLRNLAKLYSVSNINTNIQHSGGSSNNLIKWLFAQETETESPTQSSILTPEITPISIEPEITPINEPGTPSVPDTNKKHLMIIFIGLPKCGKTRMSIQIINTLKTLKLKTKFVETTTEVDDFSIRKYYDNIKKLVDAKTDVIICNGNNYVAQIRKTVTSIAKDNSFDILFVDFKHSEDSNESFDKYKEFCTQTIQARTDSVALDTDLTKAVLDYAKLSQQEQDENNYIKIYINHNKQKNINSIVLKIKEILGI